MGETQGSKALLDGPMQFHPQREPKGYRFTGLTTVVPFTAHPVDSDYRPEGEAPRHLSHSQAVVTATTPA